MVRRISGSCRGPDPLSCSLSVRCVRRLVPEDGKALRRVWEAKQADWRTGAQDEGRGMRGLTTSNVAKLEGWHRFVRSSFVPHDCKS